MAAGSVGFYSLITYTADISGVLQPLSAITAYISDFNYNNRYRNEVNKPLILKLLDPGRYPQPHHATTIYRQQRRRLPSSPPRRSVPPTSSAVSPMHRGGVALLPAHSAAAPPHPGSTRRGRGWPPEAFPGPWPCCVGAPWQCNKAVWTAVFSMREADTSYCPSLLSWLSKQLMIE